MANFIAVVTDVGRNILLSNITKDKPTDIHRAEIGDGTFLGSDPRKVVELIRATHAAKVGGKGLGQDSQGNTSCRIPIQITNEGLQDTLYIREFGLYTKNDADQEVLFVYGYVTGNDDSINSLSPPSLNVIDYNQIRIIDTNITLTDAEYANITVNISSSALITYGDMVAYAAPIKHRHEATEIDESIGKTVELHQRDQDDRITALENGAGKGTRVTLTTIPESNWKIVYGYYDVVTGTIRSGKGS